MALEEYLIRPDLDIYFTEEFRQAVEDHMSYIKAHSSTEIMELSPEEIERHTGDLYGYLFELKKPQYMHWVIMRCSGINSPNEFSVNNKELMIPHIRVIDDIRQKLLMSFS